VLTAQDALFGRQPSNHSCTSDIFSTVHTAAAAAPPQASICQTGKKVNITYPRAVHQVGIWLPQMTEELL
jgi:hypothetical protein